ncbi:MAG: hypothetical protein IPO41_04020 [Acidobacteria bacterium]|nr:hypothetical protein [Acidobacteriota bacterium]
MNRYKLVIFIDGEFGMASNGKRRKPELRRIGNTGFLRSKEQSREIRRITISFVNSALSLSVLGGRNKKRRCVLRQANH